MTTNPRVTRSSTSRTVRDNPDVGDETEMSQNVNPDNLKRAVNEAVSSSIATLGGFKIEKYDGRISADAIDWLESYTETTALKGWDDIQRFKNFNQFLSNNAKNWYKLYIKMDANPPNNWDTLKTAFINYHVPKDRSNILREQMISRKQGNEDVIQYITDKRLLCVNYNREMEFNEMKSYIIDGLLPEIKSTITHLDSTDIISLQKHAINIEKGLKSTGKLNYDMRNEIELKLSESERKIQSMVDKLGNLLKENNKNQKQRESRSREPRQRWHYDRHGRKVFDYSGDRNENYVNAISRESSVDRSLSRNRDNSNENRQNNDKNSTKDHRSRSEGENNKNSGNNSDESRRYRNNSAERYFNNRYNNSGSNYNRIPYYNVYPIDPNTVSNPLLQNVNPYAMPIPNNYLMQIPNNYQMQDPNSTQIQSFYIQTQNPNQYPNRYDPGSTHQNNNNNIQTQNSYPTDHNNYMQNQNSNKYQNNAVPYYQNNRNNNRNYYQNNRYNRGNRRFNRGYYGNNRNRFYYNRRFNNDQNNNQNNNNNNQVHNSMANSSLVADNDQIKHVQFENARNMNNTRNLNGDIRCYNCGDLGHAGRDCTKAVTQNTLPKEINTVFCVSENAVKSNLIYQFVTINGHSVQGLIDTGAIVTLIDDYTRKILGLKIIQTNEKFFGANKKPLKVKGKTFAIISINLNNVEKLVEIEAIVIKDFKYNLILGSDFIEKANILIDFPQRKLIFSENKGINCENDNLCNILSDNKIHLMKDVCIEPNHLLYLRVTHSHKKDNKNEVKYIHTNEKLFENTGIFVKQQYYKFLKGEATIPVVNCSDKVVNLLSGTIIGFFEDKSNSTDTKIHDSFEITASGSVSSETEYESDSSAYTTCESIDSSSDDSLDNEEYYPEFPGINISDSDIIENEYFSDYFSEIEANSSDSGDNYEINLIFKNNISDNKIFSQFDNEIVGNKTENEINYKSDHIYLREGELNVNPKLSDEQRNKLAETLISFEKLFAFNKNKIGLCTIDKFSIKLIDENMTPIKQNPYKYSISQREVINKQIKDWIHMNIVEESDSPFASPVVLVNKKSLNPDGSPEQRLCIDYRKLNSVTVDDAYPIPDVKSCLSSFSKAKYFSIIDQNSGYMQFLIEEKDRPKTAFRTQDGLYSFNRLSFGLKCAPMFFFKCVNKIYGELVGKCIIPYFDDGIIFSDTFDDHIEHIKLVFNRLQILGLTLNPKKSVFAQFEVIFLGYKISYKGIDSDPSKVKAIIDFPTPQNLTNVRSFVGLANFYRRKVKDFSKIAEPLTRLTKKVKKNIKSKDISVTHKFMSPSDIGRVFYWGPEQQTAFDNLKKAIIEAPILVHFDNSLPIEIHVDGSLQGVGGVLYHLIDGELRPFCFQSWLLHESEKKFSSPEIECLAIIKITIKCEEFLIGKHFTIVTDCISLKWLNEKKSVNKRIMRWALHLQNFNYTVKHKPGKFNVVADSLSRNAVGEPQLMDDNIEKYCNLVETDPEPDYQIKRLGELQMTDNIFGQIYKVFFYKHPNMPNYQSKYAFHNNILYRKSKINNESKLLVCVPIIKILEILYAYHDTDNSGSHLGIQKNYRQNN